MDYTTLVLESKEGQEQPPKWLKGTSNQLYRGTEPQKQVVHVYEVQTGIVLQQCPIAPEHNEVSTLKPKFPDVLCKGCILTADAAKAAIMTLDVS